MDYITSLDLHIDISVEARRKLENNGCDCLIQPRDSKFKPLWHIVFPPGTRVERNAPFLHTIDSVITLPTGFAFTWIQNNHKDGRVWNTCVIPTGGIQNSH